MRTLSIIFFLLGSLHSLYAQITYPANMYPDTHVPFIYGVASGDPLPNAVVIWTKISTSDVSSSQVCEWEVGADSSFQNIIQSGTYLTDSTMDFTVNVDVQNLSPGTLYYYRFKDVSGNYSIRGRTKTAVSGNVSELKVAVMSCSSVYSGYFNAYRRLGERDVLDAVIHLGDYVYDFVDEDEEIRVPSPYPQEPQNVQEWRALHEYYLMDPDLRLARQNHPWIVLWDNHDRGGDGQYADGNRAFREYVPIRKNIRTLNDTIYRKFSFANLLDLWVSDVGSYRDVDMFSSGEYNMMGNVQLHELIDGLKSSSAVWKIMGSQKMAGGWYTHGIDPAALSLFPNDGDVFDNSSWDGFKETRARILDTLRLNGINNFMVLSGDAHISMAMDLVKNPHDPSAYNKETGAGSVGVEFLPSSISRGNFDEAGVPAFIVPSFVEISMGANPQHVYMEGVQHGYGLIVITPDSISATFCYSKILQMDTEETYKTLVVKNGENHWHRPTLAALEEQPHFFSVSNPYPNPTGENICLDFGKIPSPTMSLRIYAMSTGKLVYNILQVPQHFKTSVKGWASGMYIIQLTEGEKSHYLKFIVR